MSAKKCGDALSIGMLEEAVERVASTGYRLPDRLISTRMHKMLKRIQQKEPGWDNWTVSTEILWKAYQLGLLGDDE